MATDNSRPVAILSHLSNGKEESSKDSDPPLFAPASLGPWTIIIVKRIQAAPPEPSRVTGEAKEKEVLFQEEDTNTMNKQKQGIRAV